MTGIVTKGGASSQLTQMMMATGTSSLFNQQSHGNNSSNNTKYRRYRFQMNESVEQVQVSVKNSIKQCSEQRERMGDTFKKESLKDNYRGL